MDFYEYCWERERVCRNVSGLEQVMCDFEEGDLVYKTLNETFSSWKTRYDYIEKYINDRRRTGKTKSFIEDVLYSFFVEHGYLVIPDDVFEVTEPTGWDDPLGFNNETVFVDFPINKHVQKRLFNRTVQFLTERGVWFNTFVNLPTSRVICGHAVNVMFHKLKKEHFKEIGGAYDLTEVGVLHLLRRALRFVNPDFESNVVVNFEMEYPFDYVKRTGGECILYDKRNYKKYYLP